MNIQISVKEEFAKQTDKDFADFTGFVAKGIGTLNEKVIRQQNWMRSKDDLEELKSRALRLEGDMLETQAQLSTLHLEKDNEIDGMRAKLSDLDKQVASSEARHSIEIVSPASGRSHRDFQSAGTASYSWRTTADDRSVAGPDAGGASGAEHIDRLPAARPAGATTLQPVSLSEIRRVLGNDH